MISLHELNPHDYPTTEEIDYNLLELQRRINIIRLHYGQPLTVTSGLRSEAQQEQLISDGKSTATKSKHLTGQAVDIQDSDGNLNNWCKNNTELLESTELWCEERQGGWQHFQSIAPHSGNRFFNP